MSDVKLSVQESKFLQIMKINEITNKNTTADFIRTKIDDRLTGGFYDSVNSILRVVGRSWEDRPTYVMLTFLTSTLAAHHKLPYRSEFFRQTRQRLLKEHDEFDTNKILRGLMPSTEQIADTINIVKDRIEASVVKATPNTTLERLELERKFHERERDRHAMIIRSLDKQISEMK